MKSETIYNIHEKYNIRIPDIVRLDRKHPKLDFTQVYEDFDQFIDLNKLVYVLKHYNYGFWISFSRNYLAGKIWMINKLEEHFSRNLKCIVVGGWNGVTALLLNYIFDDGVLSTDIDPKCTEIATALGINARTADMFKIDYSGYDLIINTSCEHVDAKWFDSLPGGTIICAQSTNFEWPTHVNTVDSMDEFMEQSNLQHYYFAGRISKDEKHWRYMIIGKK